MPRVLPICQRLDCDRIADAAHSIELPIRYCDFTGGGPDPQWKQEFWYCTRHLPVLSPGQTALFERIGDISR